MPTFEQAANTLRSRFASEYHAQRSEPIGFDNKGRMMRPDGTLIQTPNQEAWLRFSIRPSRASQVTSGSAGTRRFRHPGVVIVQIFLPAGNGDLEAFKIGDVIASALRAVTTNGMRLKATSAPQFVGPDDAWFQYNSVTEFEFDLTA